MYGNNVGPSGAESLSTALKTNATLTSLDLSLNNVCPAGAESLSTALKTNTTLTNLDLSLNNVGPAGAESLATALKLIQGHPSSANQGQIVGARESLDGWKNMARRKVKNGEKSPGDNVLPDQFQTVAAILASDWAEKHKIFLAPIRSQNGGDRLEVVW